MCQRCRHFQPRSNAFAPRGWLLAGLTFPWSPRPSLFRPRVPPQHPRRCRSTSPRSPRWRSPPRRLRPRTARPASEVTVQRNDTLDRIFRTAGLDLGTLAELRRRPEVRKALDMLRPGENITLTHQHGALQSLNRQISDTLTMSDLARRRRLCGELHREPARDRDDRPSGADRRPRSSRPASMRVSRRR